MIVFTMQSSINYLTLICLPTIAMLSGEMSLVNLWSPGSSYGCGCRCLCRRVKLRCGVVISTLLRSKIGRQNYTLTLIANDECRDSSSENEDAEHA